MLLQTKPFVFTKLKTVHKIIVYPSTVTDGCSLSHSGPLKTVHNIIMYPFFCFVPCSCSLNHSGPLKTVYNINIDPFSVTDGCSLSQSGPLKTVHNINIDPFAVTDGSTLSRSDPLKNGTVKFTAATDDSSCGIPVETVQYSLQQQTKY